MGSQDIKQGLDVETRSRFIRAVLEDLEVLETMLERGLFEAAWRIGAEQEYLFVDPNLSPALVGLEILARAGEKRFTCELGRFNLEANLTPRKVGGSCFSAMRRELEQLTGKARSIAAGLDATPVLSGILPNFELAHATLDTMTRSARYAELNRATMETFGGRLPIAVQGVDSLYAWHDSVMVQAAGTSFQVHLQVPAQHFGPTFNCALLASGPLIAATANSALFAGQRLWHETRIGLLEMCADLRGPGRMRRGGRSRTSLGSGWIEGSLLELYRRDLARFETILVASEVESSREVLLGGKVPQLRALSMFNGSVWPWLRACYGVTGNRPHLRIENRILPSGPTLLDEIANAALWIGLMLALPAEYGDPRSLMSFEAVEANFQAAARSGLSARLQWIDGKEWTARELLLTRLIPLARAGLRAFSVDLHDANGLLDLVADRVRTGRTGAQWMLDAYAATPSALSRRERVWRVTQRMQQEAQTGLPVHEWSVSGLHEEATTFAASVGSLLRTDVPAVRSDDPVALAAKVAEWEAVECVAVEGPNGAYLGVAMADALEAEVEGGRDAPVIDGALLHHPPRIDARSTTIADALEAMAHAGERCAVVVEGEHLLGIVFEADLLAAIGVPRLGRNVRRRAVSPPGNPGTADVR